MFGKPARETEQLLRTMERQLDLIYTALLVRDPGTSLSADAYEGLRKQVIASSTARRQHVAQLAEIDVQLRRGASTEDLANLLTQWLSQAGVARVEDTALRDVWETTLPTGVAAEIDVPAYVDTQTNMIVRQGRLREKVEPKVEPMAAEPVATPPIVRKAEHIAVAGADGLSGVVEDTGSADASPNVASAEDPSTLIDDEIAKEK